MADTSIEWTDRVWNPTTGCDRVSPGCDHCYAMTMAKRLKGMGSAKYQNDGDPRTSGPGFGVAMHPDALGDPLKWRKPQRVFVNSMSDLFHDGVDADFIIDVFVVMAMASQHTFQILTKRHARMRSLLSDAGFGDEVQARLAIINHPDPAPADWPLPNVWLGVSAENQQWADIRISALLQTPAAVRWVSAEPLLGPIDMDNWLAMYPEDEDGAPYPGDLDWLVVGGESGRGARPMNPDWARSLRDQCLEHDVAFLFKQWGGRTPKANGRELDGRTWDQYPGGDL